VGKITHKDAANLTTANEVSQDEWKVNTLHLDSQGNTLEIARPVTLVVAASDSSAKSKAGADDVCTGTDDDVKIQALIDALPASGGTVILMEGNFEGKGLHIDNTDNVQIIGQGYATHYELKVVTQAEADAYENAIIQVESSDYCRIANIRLDGNKANQTATASPGYSFYLAIWLYGSNHTIIEDIWAEDNLSGGIYAEAGASHATQYIQLNNIIGSGNGSVTRPRSLIHGDDVDQIQINNVHSNDDYMGAITLGNARDVSINNVSCISPTHDSLTIDTASNNLKVSNCYFYDGRTGIRFTGTGSSNATFGNIIIDTMSDAGIRFHNGATDTLSNVKFSNVHMTACDLGGQITTNTGLTVDDMLFVNCSAVSNTTAGFRILKGAKLVNCVADSNSEYGFNLSLGDNHCIGCIARNNGTNGFRLKAANHRMIGCSAYDETGGYSQTYGLYLDSDVTYAVIMGNDFTDNVTGPVSTHGSYDGSTNLVINNLGYVTENNGTSSIDSGQTTKAVAHGLSATPTIITIMFAEQGTADYGRWWVDTVGATNFTLNVSVDPGASNLDFWWEAKVR